MRRWWPFARRGTTLAPGAVASGRIILRATARPPDRCAVGLSPRVTPQQWFARPPAVRSGAGASCVLRAAGRRRVDQLARLHAQRALDPLGRLGQRLTE